MRVSSKRIRIVLTLALSFVLLAVLARALQQPVVLPLFATGGFTVDGEYPSSLTDLVPSQRFGSWHGSDTNTGTLRTAVFIAPAAIVVAVAGHPSHPGEHILLKRVGTGESISVMGARADPGETWHYILVPIDRAWRGSDVQLEAIDNGTHWGDWIAVSGVRAARLDERILGIPMLSRWAYIGVCYVAIIFFSFFVLLKSSSWPRRDALFYVSCIIVTVIALATGWTSVDLSGWFATWGRDALLYGPASLYSAPWQSDNPPLNPTQMVVPAILEALFRIPDSKLDAFLFKLIPLASLFVLPLLMNAAASATNEPASRQRFRIIVCCTILNPALIYSTAVWGQTDVYAADMILAAYLAYVLARPGLGSLLFTAGILLKPQPILALPVMAVMALRSHRIWWVAGGVCLAMLSVLPSTFPHGGFVLGYVWLVKLYLHAANEYGWATLGAGTLPAILSGSNGGLVDDLKVAFLGITLRTFATATVLMAMAGLFYAAWRERSKLGSSLGLWYLACSCMIVYWMASHMHERYITYAAIFAITYACAVRKRLATLAATALTLALFLQMLLNWSIDLGWGKDVPTTMLQYAPRSVYAAMYTTLNAVGLGLLLLSRTSISSSQELYQRLRSSRVPVSP